MYFYSRSSLDPGSVYVEPPSNRITPLYHAILARVGDGGRPKPPITPYLNVPIFSGSSDSHRDRTFFIFPHGLFLNIARVEHGPSLINDFISIAIRQKTPENRER